MKINNDDIDETIEEVHKRDKQHKHGDLSLISNYEYNKDSSSNEEESNQCQNDEREQSLLAVAFYCITTIQK